MPSPAIRYPTALQPGDLIAVTAPSSGVSDALWPRLEFAVQLLRDNGYRVQLGECLNSPEVRSAPAADRAAELTAMLTDPEVRAVVPPWGGELAIDLLALLDFDAIAAADPTWLIGYSDLTTVMLPLTLRTGVATMHAQNLMDTPYEVPAGLLSWLEAATSPAGAVLHQEPSGRRQSPHRTSFADKPAITDWELETGDGWTLLDGSEELNASGRLIGGCLETLAMLPGTPFGDVPGFGRAHRDEGLIVYLEVAEASSLTAARMLHHLTLAGWFEHASAVLMGRPASPEVSGYTQHEAMVDTVGRLGVPVLCGVDVGHVPPQGVLVNGALATITFDGHRGQLTQKLV
jgi:muramoyltetrapeptide carboxypeptidase